MESLILKSRSISQDRFFQRQSERKYTQHISTVKDISNQKPLPILNNLTFARSLNRFKEVSRKFAVEEAENQRKKKDFILIQKLQTTKPYNPQHYQYMNAKGSHCYLSKNKLSLIKEQNKKLGTTIIQTLGNHLQDTKKKIKQQIKQYLKLRNTIRKCKYKSKDSKSVNTIEFSTRSFEKVHQLPPKRSLKKL